MKNMAKRKYTLDLPSHGIGVPRQLELVYGKAVKLDEIDKRILHLLSQNGRASIISIAKDVGLSRDTVKYRIDRMLREHVIQGFIAVVNPPTIGFPLYAVVLISLWNLDVEREKKLVAHVKNSPYIIYAAKGMGKWDLWLEMFAKHPGHLDEIIAKIRESFSDIIKEIEIIPIIKEYKWAEFPGVLE